MSGDEKFRRLSSPSPNGQYLFVYLLVNPNTGSIPGLYRAGAAALAEELGWPMEGFQEAFAEVSREGLARADWNARVVWIPNAIRYNQPESPNVVKSWRAQWDELPECDLKNEAFHRLSAFVESLGEGFKKAFQQAIANPSPEPSANQEQEQEQEQEEPSAGAAPPSASRHAWEQYKAAFVQRHGVEPVNNAKVQGQLSRLVARVGGDQAPVVATYYVNCSNPFYIKVKHSIEYLLRDCERLMVEIRQKTGAGVGALAPVVNQLRVLYEVEGRAPKLLETYPVGDVESTARKAACEFRGFLSQHKARNLVVVAGARESRYSMSELQVAG